MKFNLPPQNQPIPKHAKLVFQGVVFDTYQWEQQLFNGQTAVFEKLKRSDTVGVVPVTKSGKIIVTCQEQPGLRPFFGLVGGQVDDGETLEEAAVRELREEAGMAAEAFKPWFAIQPSDKIDWTIYAVVARRCKTVGSLQLDGGEKISLEELSFDDFFNLSQHKDFRDREITFALMQSKINGTLAETKSLILGNE